MSKFNNTTAEVSVLEPGLLSLVTDGGRKGMQQQGFCQSGALDEDAFRWANWLCGNVLCGPVIECIGPVKLSLPAGLGFAVTGPGAQVLLDDQPCELWHSQQSGKGATVTITPDRTGSRHYVGFSASWSIAPVAGSVSTVMRERLGGSQGNGKPLSAGEVITLQTSAAETRSVPLALRPDYSLEAPLEVVPGYQAQWFSAVARQTFYTEPYQVTSQVDRMGFRLKGREVACSRSKMRSEGINLGSIQIPADGQPIIMMKDRQTLGGYPKLGCVALYDIPRLAQAVPGDMLHFTPVDANNARARWLLMEQKRQLLRKGT